MGFGLSELYIKTIVYLVTITRLLISLNGFFEELWNQIFI